MLIKPRRLELGMDKEHGGATVRPSGAPRPFCTPMRKSRTACRLWGGLRRVQLQPQLVAGRDGGKGPLGVHLVRRHAEQGEPKEGHRAASRWEEHHGGKTAPPEGMLHASCSLYELSGHDIPAATAPAPDSQST